MFAGYRYLRGLGLALVTALALMPGQGGAQDRPLRLAAPVELRDGGFLKHLLPRFKLKHRIAVEPVDPGAEAEMALRPGGNGVPVFAEAEGAGATPGTAWTLSLQSGDPRAEKFLAWLQSPPGRAAIEGFPRGGPARFTTALPEPEDEEVIEIDGDLALGTELALRHCGRCHVVDERNRMGGIGSTPSFAAMRGRDNWYELFSKYYTENPHPSFTHVVGVTEPFTEERPTHVHPVSITLDDLEAILAFVEALEPKDLGAPLAAN